MRKLIISISIGLIVVFLFVIWKYFIFGIVMNVNSINIHINNDYNKDLHYIQVDCSVKNSYIALKKIETRIENNNLYIKVYGVLATRIFNNTSGEFCEKIYTDIFLDSSRVIQNNLDGDYFEFDNIYIEDECNIEKIY